MIDKEYFMLAKEIKSFIVNSFKSFQEKRRFKRKNIASNDRIKIIIGSGPDQYPGWVSTDIEVLDITKEGDWRFLLEEENTVDNVLAEHVWEHLSLLDGRIAFKNCYKFLKKGGKLRLAVPDGFFPCEDYINYVKPGGTGAGADDHKILFDYQLIKKELENVGYHVDLLEFWDEKGVFHFEDWTPEKDGVINRSKRFDKRNSKGVLKYTSLIVDAIKV